jgi:hypothetical protein
VPRRIIIAVLIVGSIVGIFFTGRAAITGGDEASGALPDSVDRLIPASGAEVLRQSQVGIDVADGFDAYLQVNGVEIRDAEDGLIKDLGTGLILFQPGPDRPVESLNPNQNCVVAFVYDQLEGPTAAQPVTWCFQAT